MPIPFIAAAMALPMLTKVKWIVIIIAVIAAIGAVWYMKHSYDEGQRTIGYDKAVKEYKPKLEFAIQERDAHQANLKEAQRVNAELVEANKRTVELYRAQETALAEATSQAESAQAETRRIRARFAQAGKAYDVRIAELQTKSAVPVAIGENACEEADAIARTVLRDRLRDRP